MGVRRCDELACAENVLHHAAPGLDAVALLDRGEDPRVLTDVLLEQV